MASAVETPQHVAGAPASGAPGKRATRAPKPGASKQEFGGADGWLTRTHIVSRSIYWGIHASCLFVFLVGAPKVAVLLAVATYSIRVFGITGGYHRYFAHKSYKTGRVFQFVMAFLGCAATQKGPLWWAGTHRRHHRYSDGPGDPHSPRDGWYHAHQGWVFDDRFEGTPTEGIRDFAKYPELVWLNKYHFFPPAVLALVCWLIAGFPGLVWGFAISTVMLWHATYAINSIAHLWGTRRYETGDDSRNNLLLALVTFGEGWHNNHHYYMASARNGFYWWEIDVTWYLLRALAAVGLISDLRVPTRQIRDGGSRRLERLAKAA